MNSTIKKPAKFVEKLSQSNETQKMKDAARKKKITRFMKKKLKSKVMHGQYTISKVRRVISEEGTFLWLSNGDLKAETESEISAQGQALQRACHAAKILQTETYGKRRPRQS